MSEIDRAPGDFGHLKEEDQNVINNVSRMITRMHRAAIMAASCEEARHMISIALTSGAMTAAAAEISRQKYSEVDQRISFDSMQSSCREVLRQLGEIVDVQTAEVFEESRNAALKQVDEFKKMKAMAEKSQDVVH